MEDITPLPDAITYRTPSITNEGYFYLHKSLLIIDGENTPYSGRCDSLTYSVEQPTLNTKYHDEGIYVGETSPYTGFKFSIDDIFAFIKVIDAAPDFCITFVSCIKREQDGSSNSADYILKDFPGAIWGGKSIIELLKNMREWSFMVDEPFKSDHPLAEYSKKALDILNPTKKILDEIDSLPDMHLARYLKGDELHRDMYAEYPQMSENMKTWFKEKQNIFPVKSTNQRLFEL